jgi:putative Mn2+ efflux pump MntP
LSWWTLLGIALGLAMDALAVAIAVGLTLSPITPRQAFRVAFHFGLFQFMMPVLGWLAGRELEAWIHGYQGWIAFGLLSMVGLKMLWDASRHGGTPAPSDPSRGISLVTLSMATSVDALAVGMSMALWGVSVLGPSVVIGLIAATLSAVGVGFGSRLGPRWENGVEVFGGLLLLGIGVASLLLG